MQRCVTFATKPLEREDKGIQNELLKVSLIHLAKHSGQNDSRNNRLKQRAAKFSLQSPSCLLLFLERKAEILLAPRPRTLLQQCYIIHTVWSYTIQLRWLCVAVNVAFLCSSFVDIFLCVCVCLRGVNFLVFAPKTWQGDVAFALGNVEIPQSVALGAFVAIHNTSE